MKPDEAFAVACMVLFVGAIVFGIYSEYSDCQDAGGTLVRTIMWFQCMK